MGEISGSFDFILIEIGVNWLDKTQKIIGEFENNLTITAQKGIAVQAIFNPSYGFLILLRIFT